MNYAILTFVISQSLGFAFAFAGTLGWPKWTVLSCIGTYSVLFVTN